MFKCRLTTEVIFDEPGDIIQRLYHDLTLPFVPYPELNVKDGGFTETIWDVTWDNDKQMFVCDTGSSMAWGDPEEFFSLVDDHYLHKDWVLDGPRVNLPITYTGHDPEPPELKYIDNVVLFERERLKHHS